MKQEKPLFEVKDLSEYTGRMLALENISYSFDIPRQELRQTEFFCELVERTGCGMLLDVTNLFINAFNEQFDPLDWLDQLPSLGSSMSTSSAAPAKGGKLEALKGRQPPISCVPENSGA